LPAIHDAHRLPELNFPLAEPRSWPRDRVVLRDDRRPRDLSILATVPSGTIAPPFVRT
jgi:hypothetical protein